MPPVGNDVVDLKHPENQGKSKNGRFLNRVFTAEERALISGAARPETLLWALWAAKEAAFKVVSRDEPAAGSTPKRYPIALDAGYEYRKMSGACAPAGPVAPLGEDLCRTPCSLRMPGMLLGGRANTPRGELALRIIVTDDYVHALAAATASDLDDIFQRVDPIDVGEDTGEASGIVRRQLLGEIARRLDCPPGELSVEKEPLGPGAPFVLRRGKRIAADISLSHDGRFAAFAFIIRKNS